MNGFAEKASSKVDKLSEEQIERVIKNLNEKLELRENILNNLDSGYLVLNKESRIKFFNSYLAQIFQFDERRVSLSHTAVDKIIKNGEVLDFIKKNVKSVTNETYDFSVFSPVSGEKKIRISVGGINRNELVLFQFMDITLFEKIKVEFRKNESLAQMTTMAASVAHEIKNPLASISIYLQLLNRQFDKEGSLKKKDAQKSLNVISSEIERLNKIVVDFLFAVKPMNVNLKLDDINICVKRVYELAKQEADSEHIILKMNTGRSIPKLNIDSNLIQQCILNLIRNAIQSFSDETEDRKIEISTFQDGDYVKLSVIDNGCGIENEALSKIFEPYYSTKPNGTGLGLTTIFKIIKEHGGDVNAVSEVGKGSVFTLSIPVPSSERFRLENYEEKYFNCR